MHFDKPGHLRVPFQPWWQGNTVFDSSNVLTSNYCDEAQLPYQFDPVDPDYPVNRVTAYMAGLTPQQGGTPGLVNGTVSVYTYTIGMAQLHQASDCPPSQLTESVFLTIDPVAEAAYAKFAVTNFNNSILVSTVADPPPASDYRARGVQSSGRSGARGSSAFYSGIELA